MDKIIRNIPNLFTLANMFIGCLAIVYLYYDHMYIYLGGNLAVADMARLPMACYLVFLAIGLDFFDGFLARVLNAQSELGKQLDSMADLVTFGLVPGLIMYQLIARSYYLSYDTFEVPIILFASGFILTLAGAYRLAKFNLDETPRQGFAGLPIPAMAGFVASLPLIILSDELGIAHLFLNKWVLTGIVILLSWMMLSSFPLLSLKIKSLDFKKYRWEFGGFFSGLSLMLIIIFALKLSWLWVPISFIWYLLLSAIHHYFGSKKAV